MARKKQIKDMQDVVDALGAFRSAEATIRADYAARAEKEIAKRREDVLDLLFVKHADSGPSEIANSTGLSRSTVIRWRKGFFEDREAESQDIDFGEADYAPVEDSEPEAEPTFLFTKERDTDSNVDYHVVTNQLTGESIYIVWHETFATGDSAEETRSADRPEWLTDEIIAQAEAVLGFPIPGAKR